MNEKLSTIFSFTFPMQTSLRILLRHVIKSTYSIVRVEGERVINLMSVLFSKEFIICFHYRIITAIIVGSCEYQEQDNWGYCKHDFVMYGEFTDVNSITCL